MTTQTGDTVAGGSASDTLQGASGADTTKGSQGSDTLKGGSGNEGTKGEQNKDGKPADEFKPHGAPEKYDDFKMPEGVEVDKALVEKYGPVLKKLDLSQVGAQEAVNAITEIRKADAEASAKAWDETVDTWAKDSKADTEIGGANYEANLAVAMKAVNTFLKTPEERKAWGEFVDGTGVGEHPVLKRLLYRIGKTIKDDNPNPAPGGQATQLSAEERAARLYPSMAKST